MASINDQVFEMWKQQAEFGMKLIDAMVGVSTKLRTMQLAAANDTHQRTAQAEKAVAQAKSAQDIWSAQYELTIRNCESAATYWRNVFEAMNELNGRVLQCVKESAPSIRPQGETPADKAPLALTVPGDLALKLWNDMYRQVDTFTRSLTGTAGRAAEAAQGGEEAGKQAGA